MARPTKYKKGYCELIVEYFDVPPQKAVYRKTFFADGKVKSEEPIILPAEFPTFQGFANFIGVDVNTLLNWTKEHTEFLGAYMRAKQLQEKVWLVNGMGGLYNSQFAQFFGKNCLGYKDKQETEISGDGFKVVIENATSGD
ncbi:MAG: terminase small subunit [Oscillospiraceae bacterium]